MMTKDNLTFIFTAAAFIIMYAFNKYHIFNNLIICEYIVITAVVLIMIINKIMQMENYMVMFFLVILITESVLGLSLMVNLIRTHGNDFTKSMTITKF